MGAVVGASAAQGLVSSQNRLEGVGGKLQLSSLGAGQGSKGKTGTLSIAGLYAQVGGGVSIGFRPDDSAVVSVDTFKKVTGQASPTSSSLIVKADTFENVDLVESAVTSYFTSRDKQVLVSTAKSQVDSLQQEMYTFQIFFGGIGLIALVAGCIGAVNTVLTSVLERTREIGMMKAVGASYNYILALFILESAMLGVLGGVAGNVMSLWVSSALSAVLGSSNTGMLRQLGSGGSLTPQLVAFGFAMGLGASLVAGYYPAKQAARLDPITALRY
jgi:ABC-type antimicrobial peptide transport system permease subunit